MTVVAAAICGFALDLLLGDPSWAARWHPVILMGRSIAGLERLLRRVFSATPRGERAAGRCLAFGLPAAVLTSSAAVLAVCHLVWEPLAFALQVLWSWQVLAVHDLAKESRGVYRALTQGSLDKARTAVARIVGRDTDALSAEGVTKAAVETVAENFSDGVVAPLAYLLLGGAPLALAYKAVNTMDSMVGYKNDRYLDFGRAPARLDDVANYVPARLAALVLVAVATFCGQSARGAWRIWRRDRRNHTSPNSAQCEAAMAGALGVQLAGPASYFGVLHPKPTIGDALRPVEPADILRANRMLYAGSVAALALLCELRAAVCLLV